MNRRQSAQAPSQHSTRLDHVRAGRGPRALLVCFAALVAGCSNCNEDKKPPVLKQAEVSPNTEGAPVPPPALPSGEPLAGEVLKSTVPDTVAGYTATEAAETSRSPLANGGVLTKFTRQYRRGEQTLELDVTDTLHAPLLAKVILQQQGAERKTDTSDFVGSRIGGYPAAIMFQNNTRIASASVLIGERVLVSVRVSPVDDFEAAVEAAAAMPLKALGALLPARDGGVGALAPPTPAQANTEGQGEPATAVPAAPTDAAKGKPKAKASAARPAAAAKAAKSPD